MLFRKIMLIMAAMLLVGTACTAPRWAPLTTTDPGTTSPVPEPTPTKPPLATATTVPKPTPTRLPIDGATWILESIDGEPPIKGTHLTLTVDGPQFGGYDGCNDFGGRHESGQPIIERDGTISLPPIATTLQGCVTPPGILDQADRYLDAMKQDAKARVVDDRLHILDSSGEVALVFAKEQPLPGRPIDLVGTS